MTLSVDIHYRFKPYLPTLELTVEVPLPLPVGPTELTSKIEWARVVELLTELTHSALHLIYPSKTVAYVYDKDGNQVGTLISVFVPFLNLQSVKPLPTDNMAVHWYFTPTK